MIVLMIIIIMKWKISYFCLQMLQYGKTLMSTNFLHHQQQQQKDN